jgi:hypothetical protein
MSILLLKLYNANMMPKTGEVPKGLVELSENMSVAKTVCLTSGWDSST